MKIDGVGKWTGMKALGSNQLYGESILTDRIEVGTSYHFPMKERLTGIVLIAGYQKSWYGNNTYNALQVIGFSQLTWRKNGMKSLIFYPDWH